jgi:hypothetical protein
MNSKIASLFLLFAVACNGTFSPEESESEDPCAAICPEGDCLESEGSGSIECPAGESAADCAAAYAECHSNAPEVPKALGIIVYTARDGGAPGPDPSETSSGSSE